MNKEDVICTRKEITLVKKDQDRVLKIIRDNQLRMNEEKPHAEIIRKTSLEKYECLVIEHNCYSPYDYWPAPIGIGLVDIQVDKEKNEMSGIRIIRYCGTYTFEKFTYNLDKYRKLWRAWTAIPSHKQPWK